MLSLSNYRVYILLIITLQYDTNRDYYDIIWPLTDHFNIAHNLSHCFLTFQVHFDLQEIIQVKCHLSRILGEKRLKISTVVEDTGINRGTITRLFHEKAERVELDVLDKLCCYLGCTVSDLLEPKYNRRVDNTGKIICEVLDNNGDVKCGKKKS